MVVIFHASQVRTVWTTGLAGVDIFFVISGFVMAVSTSGRNTANHPGFSFLARRLIRIAPLYWIITAVVLLKLKMVDLHPGLANADSHVQMTGPYLVSTFLFIPYRNSLGLIEPPLVVGWTLSFEVFFYLLFAIAMQLRVRVEVFLTPVMVALVMAGLFRGEHWPGWMVLTDPILLEFLAGVLLGELVTRGYRLNAVAACSVGVVGLFLFILPSITGPITRVVSWGIPATLIVLSAVMLEDRLDTFWPRWILLLGDASYSLYLSHLLILSAIVKLLSRSRFLPAGPGSATSGPAAVSMVLIVLISCILVAVALYEILEKPMNQTLRRVLLGRGKPSSVAIG